MMIDSAGSPSGRAFGQFVLVERLGIHHPDQIVDFDYSTRSRPLPCNGGRRHACAPPALSGGRLAFRVRGGLQANETRRFRIVPGSPEPPADDADSVRVVETAEHYEIANALVAVRVPRATSPARPLAPIQGVRLRDGTWAGAETGGSAIADLDGKPLRVDAMRVTFVERGPLVVTVEVAYEVPRPRWSMEARSWSPRARASIAPRSLSKRVSRRSSSRRIRIWTCAGRWISAQR